MFSLKEVQSRFSSALQYQARGEECGVVSDNFTADERMQIYRNNYVVSLTEVLECMYPMTKELVGAECFNGLARKHVLTSPLEKGDVSSYGFGFHETISSVDSVIKSVPYIADVAKLEQSIDESKSNVASTTASPLTRSMDELSAIPERLQGDILLHINPGVVTLKSSYSVFSIHHAIINHKFDNLDTTQPEAGLVFTDESHETSICPLEESCYKLLLDLKRGTTLADIDPVYLASIQQLLILNIFTGFTLEEI